MAQAKKITLYALIVFALYTIIATPLEAAGIVESAFVGISNAASSIGAFMTALVT